MNTFRCLFITLFITSLSLNMACKETRTPTPKKPDTPTWPGFTHSQRGEIEALSSSQLSAPTDTTNQIANNLAAAEFGHMLFFDENLSSTQDISCATCHQPEHGFSMSARVGMGQRATPRHPPSLLNVAYQRWFDWDGKADSLWFQAARPLENPAEHAITRTAIARYIVTSPQLARRYTELFPEMPLPDKERTASWPVEAMPGDDATAEQREQWDALPARDRRAITSIFVNVLKAIAAYEMKLVRTDSRFDRWVTWMSSPESTRQETSPLTEAEVNGLKHFIGEGRCITCHNGPMFSDMSFHNLGLGPRDWLINEPADRGRAQGTKIVKTHEFNALGEYSATPDGERARWTKYLMTTPENNGQFKTPTLRNVELTAPYMHGGHFETLEEVVRFYVNLNEPVQTGHREDSLRPVNLSVSQQLELVAFLKALTGAEPAAEQAHWFIDPHPR